MIIAKEIGGMVVCHYSNQGKMIRQIETNTFWEDAVDVLPCQFTYEETDVDIPDEEIDESEAFDVLFGGSEE